jgi:hypothetical protein
MAEIKFANNTSVSCCLSAEDFGRLVKVADENGKTVSYVMRHAVLYALDNDIVPAER